MAKPLGTAAAARHDAIAFPGSGRHFFDSAAVALVEGVRLGRHALVPRALHCRSVRDNVKDCCLDAIVTCRTKSERREA